MDDPREYRKVIKKRMTRKVKNSFSRRCSNEEDAEMEEQEGLSCKAEDDEVKTRNSHFPEMTAVYTREG